MRAIIKVDNENVAETNFPMIPREGNNIRLRNGKTYTVQSITFVESNDVSEMDYIGNIELNCI